MARWRPVPVVGGAYTDDVKPWTAQDCVNRIPVMAEREGTRSPAILRDLPGCSVFSILGSDAPIRGLHNAEGRLFAVSAQTLYEISTAGVATAIGTIPGVGRVSMAHNQITGGSEVAIATGQSGYVYNTVTDTLVQITDAGFPGAKVFDFCDGYMMFVEPLGRYWGHSDLASATEYNTLDRSEAEAQPDRIVTGIVSHREWIVLGERSTEFYRNDGEGTGTFQRINGTEAEVGAAGTFAVAKLDNTVFVVGHDGIGYRINGYQFVRITTHAIEQAWSRADLSQAYSYIFDDKGHKVWYVTMTDGQTWGYDVSTGEWHRRKSYGLDFWRMSDLVRWNGSWIGGDYSNGRLYQLNWLMSSEACEPLERSRTFAVLHDNQNRLSMNALELVYNTGVAGVNSCTLPDEPPLPDQNFVYFIGGISSVVSAVGYGSINPNSGETAVIADISRAGYEGLHEGGVGTNGTNRVFVTGFTADDTLTAYSIVGSALTLAGEYAGTGSLHGLAADGDRVYTVQRNTDVKVLMLDYDGSAWALTDSQVVNAAAGSFNHGVLLHGDYVIVFSDNTIDNRQIKAYTVTGDNFAEVGSLDVHLDEPAQPGMWSDGAYLYLDIEGTGDKVSIYTFDGSTFAEVTSTADPTGLTNGVMGGGGRVVVRRYESFVMRLDVHDFDGEAISAVTETVQVPTYVAWAYDGDTSYLYAPGGPDDTFSASLYDLSQSFTAVELGSNTTPLAIPDTSTPVTSTITVTNDLEACSGIVIDVDITHPFIGDLLVTITEPGGQVYTLHEDDGAAGTDLVDSIAAKFATGPATVNGVWTLTITDTAVTDVGTLNSWSVTRIPAVLNNRFILSIDGEAVDETLEAGFIRGCPELT